VSHEFSIEQDGMIVAAGEAPTKAAAQREANHYAMMYAQDGPVKVKIWAPDLEDAAHNPSTV
jgi:hypothetical protein